MKKKPLLLKARRTAFFAGALLFTCPVLFAQVKIGTNPTTIEATSNLEVQASTANRQFKVDKATGEVTVKDGTQGLNKVLTSDANGGASWQFVDPAKLTEYPKGKMVAGQTSNLASGVHEIIYYSSNAYTLGGVIRDVNSNGQSLKVPIAGLYMVTQSVTFQNAGCGTTPTVKTSAATYLSVNGATAVITDDRISDRVNDSYTLNQAVPLYLVANSVLATTAYANFGALAGCTTRVVDANLSVTYMP